MSTTERTITVDVLPNGDIKVSTDDMSGPLHASADAALDALTKAMGGSYRIDKQSRKHTHEKHETRHRH